MVFIKWSKINFTFSARKRARFVSTSVQLAILLSKYKKKNVHKQFIRHCSQKQVYSEANPSVYKEWSIRHTIAIREPSSSRTNTQGRFLALQNGHFTGLMSYNDDCKWFLE